MKNSILDFFRETSIDSCDFGLNNSFVRIHKKEIFTASNNLDLSAVNLSQGIAKYEAMNNDDLFQNEEQNIIIPEEFENVKFQEFTAESGVVKISVFLNNEKVPVVRVKPSNSTMYDIMLSKTGITDLPISRIGTAFSWKNNEVLISYPVKIDDGCGGKARCNVNVDKYDLISGKKLPDNILIKELNKVHGLKFLCIKLGSSYSL
ncbi:MAG: hypothetical protein HRK26_00210 [Rickettsiaceae bacterium H1]|nr:hypothetical protein [Rickettsiaceae bacterium H1]